MDGVEKTDTSMKSAVNSDFDHSGATRQLSKGEGKQRRQYREIFGSHETEPEVLAWVQWRTRRGKFYRAGTQCRLGFNGRSIRHARFY
ncbi:MAG: hypothetical protein ACI92G_003720 [Candidatus Pelagisphaera sp.]|jgi:hypothetical protein